MHVTVICMLQFIDHFYSPAVLKVHYGSCMHVTLTACYFQSSTCRCCGHVYRVAGLACLCELLQHQFNNVTFNVCTCSRHCFQECITPGCFFPQGIFMLHVCVCGTFVYFSYTVTVVWSNIFQCLVSLPYGLKNFSQPREDLCQTYSLPAGAAMLTAPKSFFKEETHFLIKCWFSRCCRVGEKGLFYNRFWPPPYLEEG